MELICSICDLPLNSMRELFIHLSKIHCLHQNSSNLRIKCCVPPCTLTYKTISGFRRHLSSHVTIEPLQIPVHEQPLNHPVAQNNSPCIVQNVENDDFPDILNLDGIANIEQKVEISPYMHQVYKLEAASLAKSNVQKFHEINNASIGNLIDQIEITMSRNGIQNQDLSILLQNQKKELKSVDSKYKRDKLFIECRDFVKAREVVIGTSYKPVYSRKLRRRVNKPFPCKMAYVPIKETLQFLLKNAKFREFIYNTDSSSTGMISHITDGSYWKSSPFSKRSNSSDENKNNTVLGQGYWDEFQGANPMGSKTKMYKFAAFYFTIQNLPIQFNSKLDNIHLFAICPAAYIKQFGINAILKPIVKDLRILETDGLCVNNEKFNFVLTSFSFDNLGGNMLYGLSHSFSANHYCRICIAHKSEAQLMTCEDPNLLRNNNPDFREVGQYGVSHASDLDSLKYFKWYKNLTADLMHDALEGVIQNEIKRFLKFIIKEKKLLSIVEFNGRIAFFKYTELDILDKPSPINLEKKGIRIGQNAAQCWCLIRNLPLILSDFVTVNSEHYDTVRDKWRLMKLLIDIIHICFSPHISKSMVNKLRALIKEHHALYKALYNAKLIPKYHFLTHYPTIILLMGPLLYLWCMRYEGKHSYFKDLIYHYKNFVNLPMTLSNQHQKLFYFNFGVRKDAFDQVCVINDVNTTSVSLQQLLIAYNIDNFDAINNDVVLAQNVTFSFNYKVNYVVTICNGRASSPNFCIIRKIFFLHGVTYFICETLEVKMIDNLKCYLITKYTQQHVVFPVDFKSWLQPRPYCILNHENNAHYIVPKHSIVFK